MVSKTGKSPNDLVQVTAEDEQEVADFCSNIAKAMLKKIQSGTLKSEDLATESIPQHMRELLFRKIAESAAHRTKRMAKE